MDLSVFWFVKCWTYVFCWNLLDPLGLKKGPWQCPKGLIMFLDFYSLVDEKFSSLFKRNFRLLFILKDHAGPRRLKAYVFKGLKIFKPAHNLLLLDLPQIEQEVDNFIISHLLHLHDQGIVQVQASVGQFDVFRQFRLLFLVP